MVHKVQLGVINIIYNNNNKLMKLLLRTGKSVTETGSRFLFIYFEISGRTNVIGSVHRCFSSKQIPRPTQKHE